MTKLFLANNDKAKSWQKGNGRMEELCAVQFAAHAPLTSPAEWRKGYTKARQSLLQWSLMSSIQYKLYWDG
jgi:hypothetical protein